MHIQLSDLQQLKHEPSAKVRAALCAKICEGYNDETYSEREAELAIEILRLLLKDTSLRVRRTLGETLQHNPDVPRDIVLALVNDHELVAEAVLSHSPVLTEDDLLSIIHSTHNLRKLMAIAARETLSTPTAKALVEQGEHSLATRVLSNSGAQIDDDTFAYILEEYYQDDSILETLTCRGNLPYHVAQKLFYLVGEHLQTKLCDEYQLPVTLAQNHTQTATEGALLRFISPWTAQQDIQQLVHEMHKQDRLTDSLIIRSLCIGDLRFFQTAIAKRAGISVSNAKILLLDPHNNGFNRCYQKAGLPESMQEAIGSLYHTALDETQLGRYFHEEFTQNLIQRIIAENKHETVEQMPAVLSMLGNTTTGYRHYAH